MEDYSGGPMRISRHQYHESNVQPYSVPQQPASTRCNTSTAKNTGESSQEVSLKKSVNYCDHFIATSLLVVVFFIKVMMMMMYN